MEKRRKQKKILLFVGLILVALSFAVGVLLASRRFEELWHWYDVAKEQLDEREDMIASLDKAWQFIGAVLLLFLI